jgi:hypothetical protein
MVKKLQGPVSPEEFVRLWQTAPTVQAAFEKSGSKNLNTCQQRAVYLRKKGVPLKRFRARRQSGTTNYTQLAQLARSLAKER